MLRTSRRLRLGSPEGIEDSALRFAVEQGLRVVLTMQVHELPPYLGQHGGRNRGAVDPGASASIRGDLTLENERVVLDLDSVLVGQRGDPFELRDIEYAFDCRLVRTGSNQIGARALAEQQPECSNDDRFSRARLSGEDVEPLARAEASPAR